MDSVKLVIVDLDDTLWRGVAVEDDAISPIMTEGWPLGIAEALLYLKRRGIVLAIVSKNDGEKISAIWPRIFGGRLQLDDFAVRMINWDTKAENIAKVLAAVNVLPSSAVFIDDNPVERSIVEMNFPGVRTLGADVYHIRRVLLHSAETQVALISEESSRRTEMIRSQVIREAERSRLSREDFLASLNVSVEFVAVRDTDHPKFKRSFELINKTNQFNTTGRRWALEEMARAFASGAWLLAFEVQDKHTAYGLVGVAIIRENHIEQFVMSCRVIGLDVEQRAMAEIEARLFALGYQTVGASFVKTAANLLAADLFSKTGFVFDNDQWGKEMKREAVSSSAS